MNPKLALFFAALVGSAASANTRTVLLDFNSTAAADNTVNPSGGLVYNNATLPSNHTATGAVPINGAAALALTDDTNTTNNWSLAITKSGGGGVGASGSGANYTGTYPAAVSSFSANALKDGLFVNNSAILTLTFSGLDPGKTYDLLTYGARGNTGTSQPYTLAAGSSASPASVSFSPLNNNTTAPAWSSIIPTTGGLISLEISAVGSGSPVQALNFLRLTEVGNVAEISAAAVHLAFHNTAATATAMNPANPPLAQGVNVNTSNTTWNNIVSSTSQAAFTIPSTPLLAADGISSGASVSGSVGYTETNAIDWAGGTKDHVMMADWFGMRASEAITISGLHPDLAANYHVVVYGDSNDANRSMNFTLGGVTKTITDSGTFAGNFTEGANYVVFPGLSGSSFTLTGNSGTSDPRSSVSGISIVPGQPFGIGSFTASSAYVTPGTNVTLSWSLPQAADTLEISPGVGVVTGSSVQLAVSQTTTYTLTATYGSQSATATLRVTVGPPRPNVVMFLADDMGVMDTSVPFVYVNGQPVTKPLNLRYRTPNMETLAARGMRFTNAAACTVCSPSRTSLMTGKNATRHHVTTWTSLATPDDTGDPVNTHNLLPPADWAKAGTDPNGQLLPRLLRNAGYSTISIGKGHFGPNSEPIHDPRALGFDVNIAGSGLGGPGSYLATQNFVKSNPAFQVPGLEAYWGQDIFLTEALTREAKHEISTAVPSGKPFFAYMSHYAVHATFEDADPRFSANYPTLSGYQKNFATLIEGMDQSLGDLMQQLKDLGIAKNTLIVFMGDNGSDAPIPMDANGIGPSAPYRGKKGHAYEGGTRVPLIIGWAETDPANPFQQALPIPGNSVCEDIVTIWDLFPTILGAAGVSAPLPVDGWDLRPYLKVEPGYHRPQEFLLNFPHSHEYQDYYALYRVGGRKLIYRYETKSYELYDLAVDVGEQNNLAVNPTPENAKILMKLARGMARGLVGLDYQPPRDRLASGTPHTPPVMPAISGVDSDGDGIPDITEDPNGNGLVDPGETDPDNPDSDGDGTSDGAELRLGTNPLDATSSFRIHIENLPAGIRLSWPSLPGTSFGIRSSPDLADWSTVVADNFPAAPAPALVTSFDVGPPDQQVRFFRVSLQ